MMAPATLSWMALSLRRNFGGKYLRSKT